MSTKDTYSKKASGNTIGTFGSIASASQTKEKFL